MKYKDIKTILKFPTKVETPLIVIFDINIQEGTFTSHTEYAIRIFFPMIEDSFRYKRTFKTLMKAFNAAKKMSPIIKVNDIVKVSKEVQ